MCKFQCFFDESFAGNDLVTLFENHFQQKNFIAEALQKLKEMIFLQVSVVRQLSLANVWLGGMEGHIFWMESKDGRQL